MSYQMIEPMLKAKRCLFNIWILVMIACCFGCSGESTKPSTEQPTEREVIPGATDSAIVAGSANHVVIYPGSSAIASGKLFVFLPGTGGAPTQYRLILQTAAEQGYYAIGLDYPNPTAIGSLCRDSEDNDCYWDARREVVLGIDASALISVNYANSIINRLQKLLAYLHTHYPDENWEQFLLNDLIDWSRIVVAGHSQGGGHAGVIAKLYLLERACYFDSPADWSNPANAQAAWLSLPNVTPAANQFGFTHYSDNLVPVEHLFSIWAEMGLQSFGNTVSVDDQTAPYAHSHQLTTSLTPNLTGGATFPYHGATVVDAATPLTAADTPVFESVWIYMCFP